MESLKLWREDTRTTIRLDSIWYRFSIWCVNSSVDNDMKADTYLLIISFIGGVIVGTAIWTMINWYYIVEIYKRIEL